MQSSKPSPLAVGDGASVRPVFNPAPASATSLHTEFTAEPETLNALLALPVERLGEVDIARMNLLCASALPDTKGLDVEHALSVLDDWAARVASETDRHLDRVTDPRFAERYRGSEAHFRAEMLAQVLQEDLGVKYDMKAVGSFSFADPSVAFIHGMIPPEGGIIADTPGGTCVSMPVLYVAVGRRLGYPLKLATTDSHIFARWDGKDHENQAYRDYFNCETTNGFHRFDDDHYRTWPKPVTDQQVAVNGFLKSLNPAEELAQFLATRGHHAFDVGQVGFAARCYENAHRYDTTRPAYRSWLADAARRSGYRPKTPALHRMIVAQRALLAAERQAHAAGILGSDPLPSRTRVETPPGIPTPWGDPTPSRPPLTQPPSPSTFHEPPPTPR